MNIFATDNCPIKSAMFLDIKRRNKMIIECAQLLSSALNLNGVSAPYKTTHKNHPAAIWVRTNQSNFRWVLEHYKALSEDFVCRRGKIHKSGQFHDFFLDNIDALPEGEMQGFVNCAANGELGISYKHIKDTCLAYQMYLNERWDNDKMEPKWE